MERDLSSYSKPEEVAVTHLDWKIRKVDFDKERLFAEATYSFRVVVSEDEEEDEDDDDRQQQQPQPQPQKPPPQRQPPSSSRKLNLDTAHLEIESVTAAFSGAPLKHTLHPIDETKQHLGRRLEIDLPPVPPPDDDSDDDAPPSRKAAVTISYATTTACSALQFLSPSQTAGKKRPYAFTQCQAIHARSLVPCQDRCGVKMTYRAEVTVPSWSTCVMSAVPVEEEKKVVGNDTNDTDTKICVWDQPVPVSSYLIALAVGELTKKKISDRCAVYSEPSVVESAASEFSQTEDFLKAAEEISGLDYAWGRYDLLCLPPSFPYG